MSRVAPSLRLQRLFIRTRRTLSRLVWGHGTVYVGERLDEYRNRWEDAARRISAEFTVLTDEIWEVRLGNRSTRISNHCVQLDDLVTMLLAGDKPYGYELAASLNIPTPKHRVFSLADMKQAATYLRSDPGPLVVKPARGSASGIGVSTHVASQRDLRRAACLASLFCDRFLVEQMVFGETCRLLFLDGSLLHAVRRRGVRVEGNGRSKIRQLLDEIDGDLAGEVATGRTLRAQRLSLDTVPERGVEVLARGIPANKRQRRELRTVYDETITSEVGAGLVEECRRIVDALGSRFAGVDVITVDPAKSLSEGGGAFIEVNTTPGIHHHEVGPQAAESDAVAVQVLRHLLTPNQAQSVAGEAP